MTASSNQPLSDIQLEILQLFSTNLSEKEMLELRQILIDFQARRLQDAIQQLNPSPAKIKQWAEDHDRTPYSSAQK